MKNAIPTAQLRAARALLGWSREQLSEHSGVPLRTLARLETEEGETRPRPATIEAVTAAFETAGVEFIPTGAYQGEGGLGVRMKTPAPE